MMLWSINTRAEVSVNDQKEMCVVLAYFGQEVQRDRIEYPETTLEEWREHWEIATYPSDIIKYFMGIMIEKVFKDYPTEEITPQAVYELELMECLSYIQIEDVHEEEIEA